MAYIDPVEASPDNYRVLLETDAYRMLEMRVPAGTSDIEHSHPSEAVYFVRGGKARVHLPDGETIIAPDSPGSRFTTSIVEGFADDVVVAAEDLFGPSTAADRASVDE